MKKFYLILFLFILVEHVSGQNEINLNEFQMSNNSSPAFSLLEQTSTDIYTPENIKALALHLQNNFGESMAIEIAPYFFINPKSKNRTYDKFVGVFEENGNLKQNPFTGLNTTTFSFTYLKKDFENIVGDIENKTFALGVRTTLIRFYNKARIIENKKAIQRALMSIGSPPQQILTMPPGADRTAAIKNWYLKEQKINDKFDKFQKTIKPIFRIDLASAYSELFIDNTFDSKTVNRYGAWLTGELSLLINADDDESTTNNYINFLFMSRYIEDGFVATENSEFSTNYYRDFGTKIDLDLGKFSLGYEYVNRNGSVSETRSVGSLSFALDEDITLIGGFGKDFNSKDNLLALFGINWGFDFGNSSVGL